MTDDGNKSLAEYIFLWLANRSGEELNEALGNMRVSDFKDAKAELELILDYRGKPPNWIS